MEFKLHREHQDSFARSRKIGIDGRGLILSFDSSWSYMADHVVDAIVEDLKTSGSKYFPEYTDLKAVRVVGHTPKPEHYTYEIVVDFSDGSERVSAKVYRPAKSKPPGSRELAQKEFESLKFAHESFSKYGFDGVPHPVGDFSELGAVVSRKVNGLPLQSIIMKSALLPDFGNHGVLESAAKYAGQWLKRFHSATAGPSAPVDGRGLIVSLEKLTAKALKSGLPEESTEAILENAHSTLNKSKKPLPCSALLNNFVPLNVMVTEEGIGFFDFAELSRNGMSLHDVATFVASVETLEKYPFCDRSITTLVQDAFLDAYQLSPSEQQLLSVVKMKILLEMFAHGRVVKESAVRKQVMWANVMKRFIQQAADRAVAPAA